MNAFGARLGAGLGSGDRALLAFDPEADQRTDRAAELDRLVLGEVAEVLISISPSASLWTASASITRTVSLSRSRSSSAMISPWNSGWLKPRTMS